MHPMEISSQMSIEEDACINCGRSAVPEDATKNLFLDLYEQVVFSDPDRRRAAIKMLSAIYAAE